MQCNYNYYIDVFPRRVVLAGDSAGGNLCAAVTGLAIKYGTQVPDGLFLAYPVLDVRFKYSPSHVRGLTDQILSHTIMDICIKAYTDRPYCDADNDPFISPAKLSDEILQRFPPVRLMVGCLDPLHDHSVRFVSRLLQNHIDVHMTEYE